MQHFFLNPLFGICHCMQQLSSAFYYCSVPCIINSHIFWFIYYFLKERIFFQSKYFLHLLPISGIIKVSPWKSPFTSITHSFFPWGASIPLEISSKVMCCEMKHCQWDFKSIVNLSKYNAFFWSFEFGVFFYYWGQHSNLEV